MRSYRVQVAAGRLALVLDDTGCPVVQVGLDRVAVRPLGRAGGVVVTVDGAPLWVDFSDRRHGTGPGYVVRRVRHGWHGRRIRQAFLTAIGARR